MYFFGEEGVTITLNFTRYVSMLRKFLPPRIDEISEEHTLWELWFQQDEARAHTTRNSLDALREKFPGRLVSMRGDVEWPARSSDLCMWEYLKKKCPKTAITPYQS